jgi:hypothetical protein
MKEKQFQECIRAEKWEVEMTIKNTSVNINQGLGMIMIVSTGSSALPQATGLGAIDN